MPDRLITDTAALAAFCRRLAAADYVAVDTEFMREETYWPRLCLVQLAGPDEARAVDVMADGIALAPLFALMANEHVLKVFHAARQDLEIFHHLTDRLPAPIFDTQVAAMVCGFGDAVGYDTLVAKVAKAHIDKSSRFTDWSRRPLSMRQVDYALADVTHLRPVYEMLRRKLAASGHEGWLAEEMGVLTDPGTYAPDVHEIYRRLRIRRPTSRTLAVLRELAAWREVEAQRQDVPRGRILRDETVEQIAHHRPRTAEELRGLRGGDRRLSRPGVTEAVLAAVRRGLELPDVECPAPPESPDLTRGRGPLVDLLKVLLKMKCDTFEVAQKLVASATDVELLAAHGEDAGVHALTGWRREVFGADALRLRAGEIALAVSGRKVRIVPLGEAAGAPAPGSSRSPDRGHGRDRPVDG